MLRAYLIYFSLLIALVVSQDKQCTRDSDCADQECCITFGRKRFLFSSGHCKKFSDNGEACEPPELSHGTEHTFNCPCVGNLECHGEKESHEGGSSSYTNPRCTDPITPTPTLPQETTTVVV